MQINRNLLGVGIQQPAVNDLNLQPGQTRRVVSSSLCWSGKPPLHQLRISRMIGIAAEMALSSTKHYRPSRRLCRYRAQCREADHKNVARMSREFERHSGVVC